MFFAFEVLIYEMGRVHARQGALGNKTRLPGVRGKSFFIRRVVEKV